MIKKLQSRRVSGHAQLESPPNILAPIQFQFLAQSSASTMASRALLRSLRAPHLPLPLTRSYVTPARTWTPRTPATKSAAPIVAKALASTVTPSAGTPDTSNTPPPTVEGTPELPSALPEAGAGDGLSTDWSKSYHGLSSQAFAKEVAEVLLAPLDPLDVEMKPGALLSFFLSIGIRNTSALAFASLFNFTFDCDSFISTSQHLTSFLRRPDLPPRDQIPTRP